MRTQASALGVLLAWLQTAAAQPRQPQRIEAPKWLSDDAKDVFSDIEGDENPYSDNACELREKLLKSLAGHGEADAPSYRMRTLQGLGYCEFKKGNYALAKKRLENCVSEINMPNEEALLQNPRLAPLHFLKQAADFLAKREVTQAATAMRRSREVMGRNAKKILQMVHKQMEGQAPPLDKLLEELPGFGKTGTFLPKLLPQVPILKEDCSQMELLEGLLDGLDRQMAAVDLTLKDKRLKLEVAKGKSGSLMYVRALISDPLVDGSNLQASKELVDGGAIKAFLKESEKVQKAVTLLKRSKEGDACKEDDGLPKTCAALKKIVDLKTNVFGETRVLQTKAGKRTPLETCTTNANVGVLVASKEGVNLSVAGLEEPVPLEAGVPVVVDFCREVGLESETKVPVLFAQAWHPEFAPVERTTELRTRAKNFGLSEDEVKSLTKEVNDNAKKSFDKGAKLWREGSSSLERHREAARAAEEKKAQAATPEVLPDDASEEERKRALEELERKREERRIKAEKAEEARKRRKQQLEEERAKKDPWLLSPEVVEAEKRVEDLKEQRRDANAKLEFDLSTQLTKDISAAERALKKAIKQAKKAHKKGQGSGDVPPAPAKEEAKTENKAEALKKELEEVKRLKAEATKAEDFGEAKRLKDKQKALEDSLKKLEL